MSAWVFGYGSLVWRPAFAHAERVPAYIDGWKRRFWQASPDHRGTPNAPGRVVTLLPEPGARTWGMAYRIEPGHEPTVLAALDHREKAGYEHHRVALHLLDARVIEGGLVYVASVTNPNFVGPSHPDDLARLIETRAGPSGPNIEYVLELARALAAMGARDPHVEDLARRLRPDGQERGAAGRAQTRDDSHPAIDAHSGAASGDDPTPM